MTFPAAPLDTTAKVLTAFLLLLMIGLSVAFVLAPVGAWQVPLVLLYIAIPALSWAMAPRAYELQGHQLVVRRHAWRPFETDISSRADVPKPHAMGLRTLGSGGAWGYWGRFRRRDIGGYRAYITNRAPDHVVALRTGDGIVMVSPLDRDGFVTTVETLR